MGFLWFGTKDGLNRFDGYSFKKFRKGGNPKSIGNNYIHTLYEDRKGTLLVGTEDGLYEYTSLTEEFHLVPATAHMYIDNILEDRKGNLWLISYYQLFKYSRQTKTLEVYSFQKFFTATSFCATPDGTIWIGTATGLLKKYNPESNSFSGFDIFGHSKINGRRWIESLYTMANGQIIAGTSDTVIKKIDPYLLNYTDIEIPNSGQANLYIKSIFQTKDDELWLGTESGVFVYNIKTGRFYQLKKNYNDPYSITDNSISTICGDREGGVWVGTNFGGINYLPNQPTPIVKYFPRNDENSLSGNVISEIKQDLKGNLWIGTGDAGLNKLEIKTGKITQFKPTGEKGSICYSDIHGLLADKNELWIGTYEHGIDVMNVKTGKVMRHYQAWVDGFTHNFVYIIYQTASGQKLIGTPHGIFAYNQTKNKFELFTSLPPAIWYTSILQDKQGVFWGASFGNGVHYFNPKSGKKASFTYDEKDAHSLSNNRVCSIFEDSKHNIWFATEDGLCKWNEQAQNFTRYGTSNGFPTNFMLCILEDKQQNLWISTTKGLVCFNPASEKVEVYTTANGLLSDQFNYNSAFKDADGRMYFGSAKGLISFRPEEFKKSSFVPTLYITGFQVNDKEVNVNNDGSPLKQSITYTKEITLPYNQSTLSIDFAALNYTAPEKLQYTYEMEGLSKNWINLNSNRRVDFIGLSPGSYTFKIKASNADDIWTGPTILKIIVLPPWWKSRWAYAAYAFITILIIVLITRFFYQRMQEKNRNTIEMMKIENEKEMLKMELAKEKELADAKVEFFTNVAHEIRTPLTLIKVPLSKVIKKASGIEEIKNSLTILERNTNRLIHITNQLLDFRQTEINKFNLYFERVDIASLVREAYADFATLAEQNDISASINLSQEPLFAFVDVDAFQKIVYNLFSNAVKYAATKVEISLRFNDDMSFTLQVKNDGYLIPERLKEKIFEPFFRLKETESQTGTGIGLALSLSLAHLHGGVLKLETPQNNMNVFTLKLPTHPDNSLTENFEFIINQSTQGISK
jgi:ligand-binding sensor domain-containing protein/signal transduction histidine kinase